MGIRKVFFRQLMGRKNVQRLLDNIFSQSDVSFYEYMCRYVLRKNNSNPMWQMLRLYGVGYYGDSVETGEHYVLDKILPAIIAAENLKPTFFDVGSNVGNYAKEILEHYPQAELHCFEPNQLVFKQLQSNLASTHVKVNNKGLGDKQEISTIYYSDGKGNTEHGSLYKEVIEGVQHVTDMVAQQCEIDTLDNYTRTNAIRHIHFLKVDTEGFELSVLKGAEKLIADKRIDVIQFEFNEMNVVPKVFLGDFFRILKGYQFYRLSNSYIIPLKEYSPSHEMFAYQNILAVKDEFVGRIEKFERLAFHY